MPSGADGNIVFEMPTGIDDASVEYGQIIGFSAAATPTSYPDVEFGISCWNNNGARAYHAENCSLVNTVTPAAGDLIKLERVGATLKVSISKDGGANWTLYGQRTGGTTGALRVLFTTATNGVPGSIRNLSNSGNFS